ncbi:NAD(P)-binding domain-containing protein [Nocardioides sp.]|uniref:NAD(P)-dependent oxidoreductase n=1 Tax=Nocardioides sp. TaxID=35761 RepID=UPI001A243486|nr:NAD(P)-binding domain-containing protein [Nocardioides sp.]MBJ7358270.1 NAD(P)-dependent oxidoreductase [Nocardioides sp.]
MRRVSILGLGRMGLAAAERYAAEDWAVTAWSRGGRTVHGVRSAASPGEAAGRGDPVVLFLFDGPSCLEVLAAAVPGLRSGTLVVNTATTAPDEAERCDLLVRDAGGRYVHAPVLGSVPAVRAGTLVAFAGGAEDDVDEAADVLAPLVRELVRVPAPGRAAALKLVANTSLGGALAALAETLEVAQGLGVERVEALEVLARGRLAGVVDGSRHRLLGLDRTPAHFTLAALAKDLRLARDASGVEPAALVRAEAALDGGAPADGDITELVR